MNDKQVHGLFVCLNCLLITLFAFTCSRLFYSALSRRLMPPAPCYAVEDKPVIDKASTRYSPEKPLTDYSVINRRNLFDVSEVSSVEPQDDISDLELTELSLKLHGTSVRRQGPSYAVLENTQVRRPGKPTQLVKEGDMISEAELAKVYRDKVVLEVDGAKQVLLMEEYSRQSRGIARTVRPGTKHLTPIQQTKVIKKHDIDNAMRHMGDFMKQARISPHYTNGVADGFRVTRIRPRSLFRKLGLVNGDIITGVNGQTIRSADDAMAFYQDLSSGRDVGIQLKRRGRNREITYRIR